MRQGLAPSKNGLIAALDVGSSKVCCLVARLEQGKRPNVVGIGQQVSRGVRGGTVVDMEATQGAVASAVHAAEQMAGETIDRVVVNLSGGHPSSSSVDVEVSISGHAVGDSDLRRALDQGHRSEPDDGSNGQLRQLIHSIPLGYRIDGSRGIRDPRGMYGDRLGVSVHFITAGAGAIRNLIACVEHSHLDAAALVVSPYASGLASLVEDELELGVTLIDMGGGTTTIAVFLEGSVIYTDVLRVGGMHVTNDIARGLSTPLVHAERIKTLYGHAMVTTADERELIEVPQVGEDEGQPQQVPRSLLVGIIQPRLEETFELVRSRLEASGFDKIAGRRVVLTGGASQLTGVRELAGLVLDKQIRIGKPIRVEGLAESTSGPAYATSAGLLTYAAAMAAKRQRPRPETEEPSGLVGRIGQWFREHL
ncbi:MAG: cell division protein FtsA [Kiloniellales bacterium]|nr:cell division protein FtsA [Kiloniellales bacterium]